MEKASKWIQNFLLGKRYHQEKKKDKKTLFAADLILHPKEKRRWSFKKSPAGTDKLIITHKTIPSFDTPDQLVKPALQEQDIGQIRIKPLLLQPSNNSNEAYRRSRADLMPRKYAAAIKIQSVFRSYLARRALKALRALVKLQALVRGHLVRKQTNTVLRCMQSLMTIQVRARFKRLQMPDANNNYIIQLQPQKLQPSTKSDTRQQRRRSTSKNKSDHTQLLGSPVVAPTYMSDTESSKAKNRSQSEPKRRPIHKGWSTREKSSSRRRSMSTTEEGLGMSVPDQQQNMQYPWLFRLYRSTKPAKESDMDDSASVTTYNSNYYASPFEQPPVNLY